jgi:hypothetical protein
LMLARLKQGKALRDRAKTLGVSLKELRHSEPPFTVLNEPEIQKRVMEAERHGIGAVGLFALIAYTTVAAWKACLIREGNNQGRQAFETANRPIIAVASYGARDPDFAHPGEFYAYVNISNFGHLPAKVHVRKAAEFYTTPSVSGPNPMGEKPEDLTVPPGAISNRIDYSAAPDPTTHKGSFYLAAFIEYETLSGETKQTRFCLEFPWPDTLPAKEARLCTDPKTNYIE